MKIIHTLLFLCLSVFSIAQESIIKGQLQDAEGTAIGFANVVLYQSADSSIYKVEISDEAGIFTLRNLNAGNYYLTATFVGLPDLLQTGIKLGADQVLDLGVLRFTPAAVDLVEATVTATRALVEIKPDRTVFNVQGTINSIGSDAIELLRKAPGVTVDNNDNINVLGRSGVMVYVDGKRLPLSGADLSNYLKSLTADQIDRFDIITNPGARYEAEGNAGIIDIRLKKDENLGANGTVNLTGSQGRYTRGNGSVSGNFRSRLMNIFATAGASDGESYHDMFFQSFQNNLYLDAINEGTQSWNDFNFRLGTDFFLNDRHTVGFLVSGFSKEGENYNFNRISIAPASDQSSIDSILVARNTEDQERDQYAYNLNYRFDNKKGRSLNLDLDYGNFDIQNDRYQPNRYYDATEQFLLSENIDLFQTSSIIDIYTFKLDYEEEILGGKLAIGTKLSRVESDNLFLVSDEIGQSVVQNDTLSNRFEYTENVYAGYVNYARQIHEKWNISAGIRAEQTDATGDLQAFLTDLQEPPVNLNYLSWFPSAGITWQAAPQHSLSLNYGRRINRPDYDVLNPFNSRLSELSYMRGNPRLNPEIVNNLELGWTYAYRYNFKIAYSRTMDQITRLIQPDDRDERAGFITWANLAHQSIWSFSTSLPFQWKPGWSSYFNASASYIDNQASYPDGGVVDVQAFTYSFYTQQTIDLPGGFKGEVSGYFSGPGVWGGVFLYNSNWSLNLGLQKRFLKNNLNVRLSVDDIFFQTGWDGESNYNGLRSFGSGRWDSRRGTLSLSYQFGNDKIKTRKRETGLEKEAKRVGGS